MRYIIPGGTLMDMKGISFTGNYLESLPINKITKYPGGPPKNALSFTGYPQQHPAEKNKLILVHDPLGNNPALLEFKLDDILFVEDVLQAVTESGEGVPLVKLWIRRGAHGMFLEPFEVDEPVRFIEMRGEFRERFVKQQESSPRSTSRKPL
jgi:inorganic pyrophosphatase